MLHNLLYFPKKMCFFHNFIFFCSNNMFFINHALRIKYQSGQIKVNHHHTICYSCIYKTERKCWITYESATFFSVQHFFNFMHIYIIDRVACVVCFVFLNLQTSWNKLEQYNLKYDQFQEKYISCVIKFMTYDLRGRLN